MGSLKTDSQKCFDSTTAYVSLIPNVLPDTNPRLTDQQKLDDYYVQNISLPTIPLRSFLEKSPKEQNLVRAARAIKDSKKKQLLIHKKLPAIVIPIKVWSRDFSLPYSKLVKEYNALILLEFPCSQDTEKLMTLLKSLPWVWYVTISADGENVLAIVPLDNCDYEEHYKYYDALRQEFRKRGFHILERCGNLLTLMFKTDDPDAWMNEHCTLYRLPGH